MFGASLGCGQWGKDVRQRFVEVGLWGLVDSEALCA